MNFTTRQLQAFATLARLQSFSRAAQEIHITQAGLSLMIKDLEAQVGFRLFDRTTRAVALTAAGAKFLPVVSRSMQDINEAAVRLARVEEQAQYFLTVAATPLVCGSILPVVLRELRRSSPHIQVTVKDSERAAIQAMVETAEVDLGLGILLKPAAGVQRISLCPLSLMCIRPREAGMLSRNASRRSMRWLELRDKALVGLPPGNDLQLLIDSHLNHIGRTSEQPRLTFNNLLTVVAMVEAGLGHAVLPSFARAACERYEVELVDLVRPHVPIDLYAITRRGTVPPAAVPVFLDAFRRHLSSMEGIGALGLASQELPVSAPGCVAEPARGDSLPDS